MEIGALLRDAETDAEKVSAAVRLVVFPDLGLGHSFRRCGAKVRPFRFMYRWPFYGVGAVIGLVLAWLGIFHPAIPYLFVTFDVLLVSLQLLMLTGLMAMAPSFAFALPAAGLIFVILIHASMRYRPLAHRLCRRAVCPRAWPGKRNSSRLRAACRAWHGHDTGRGRDGIIHELPGPPRCAGCACHVHPLLHRPTDKSPAAALDHPDEPRREAFALFLPQPRHQPRRGRRRAAPGRPASCSSRCCFVDIRGFTALGEAMLPEELSAFLTEFRNRLTKPIFSHEGTVDKFIGDAIMAVFGTPLERADDAQRAIACAIGIIDAAKAWSQERLRSGLPPVEIGIGLHYGAVFAGALGDEQLLEYTVIGDTVNVAERLERLSREVGSPLVVSASLLAAAADPEIARWRRPATPEFERAQEAGRCVLPRSSMKRSASPGSTTIFPGGRLVC